MHSETEIAQRLAANRRAIRAYQDAESGTVTFAVLQMKIDALKAQHAQEIAELQAQRNEPKLPIHPSWAEVERAHNRCANVELIFVAGCLLAFAAVLFWLGVR